MRNSIIRRSLWEDDCDWLGYEWTVPVCLFHFFFVNCASFSFVGDGDQNTGYGSRARAMNMQS